MIVLLRVMSCAMICCLGLMVTSANAQSPEKLQLVKPDTVEPDTPPITPEKPECECVCRTVCVPVTICCRGCFGRVRYKTIYVSRVVCEYVPVTPEGPSCGDDISSDDIPAEDGSTDGEVIKGGDNSTIK